MYIVMGNSVRLPGAPLRFIITGRAEMLILRGLVMFPYSYSCSDFPKDAETLMEAALGVAKSVKGIHGTSYQAGQACDLI